MFLRLDLRAVSVLLVLALPLGMSSCAYLKKTFPKSKKSDTQREKLSETKEPEETMGAVAKLPGQKSSQAARLDAEERQPASIGHWGYHGSAGPEHWGDLRSEFRACKKGRMQSPIDLKWKKPLAGGQIKFMYHQAPLRVIDNGHSIQVNFPEGSKVDLRGHLYELVQLHFHSTSEHTISGRSYPLEMHLVHKDAKGEIAMVGVMFVLGAKNRVIDKIWEHLPRDKNHEVVVTSAQLNPSELLPHRLTYYHYIGSQTKPPCREGVNWNVFNTPVELSLEQLERFRVRYAHNNRPVQRLHGRRPANY